MQEAHMANCLEVAFKTNVTKPRRQSLVVKTADCMPVIITDEKKIGIVHIGWKGLENKIFHKILF